MNRHILVTAMLSSVLALTACGNKGGSNNSNNGNVGPYVFDGEPRNFDGRYKGNCVVASQNHAEEKCVSEVRIEQSPTRLLVRTKWTVGQNRRARAEETVDKFRIEGKSIISDRNETGTIGADAFGFGNESTGEAYVFRLRPDRKYEFITSSVDKRGRKFSVYGSVVRTSRTR